MTPQPQEATPSQSTFRSTPALAILTLAIVAQGGLWWWLSPDSSKQVLSSWVVLPATALLLTIWWLFFSGVRWLVRTIGAVAAAGAVVLFFGLFRFDGYTGDFIPQFAPRWQPTPEELLAQQLAAQRQSGGEAPEAPPQTLEVTDADWPQFGGPQRDSIARGERLRRNWKENPPKLLWKHRVGPAWSSFAVVDRFAFTQEQHGDDEVVICYEADTGRTVWTHADPTRFASAMGGDGPRATPTVHDSKIYALGATGILNCLEASTGKPVWSRNILEDAKAGNAGYGMCGSPLVFDNLVVVAPGGHNNGAVAAYDKTTGERVWAGGNHDAGYASPILATIGGVRQILVYDADGVGGYDVGSGRELWHFPWENGTRNNIVQPIVREDGSVFVSGGYSAGSALVEVEHKEDAWETRARWEARNEFKLKFNGGVARDGCVYGLDEGILSCFDLNTGQRRWRKGRYRYGQVLLLDDALLVTTDSGEAVLVDVSPQQATEVARFQAVTGKTWNHPVVNRGRLFIRSDEEAACYDLRPAEAK